ncbi:hypothetical protein [Lachnotalea glycerini]|uniref:Uncharacterized protein n=1 Tax=Lachnotalea glycerini TaxID=1763509 RepID=A0A371J636_9FIRM|nr:hypothetical protein [Lachnotalea glycerini]RDY28128.1 hypothetical protein CG710_019910 [Lachnotalea glycerini]
MKKSIILWLKISNKKEQTLKFVFCCLIFIFCRYYFTPLYKKSIANIKILNRTTVILLIFFFLIAFMGILLKHIFFESVMNNMQFQYFLNLNKKEYYLFLLFDNNSMFYFYLIVLFCATPYSNNLLMIFFILYVALFFIISFFSYYYAYKQIQIGSKYNSKKRNIKKKSFVINRKYPNLELIYLGVIRRYRIKSLLISKIVIVLLVISLFKINLGIIFYFILNVLLIISNDGFWNNEIDNAFYLKTIGISFYKYININLISGLIFNSCLIGTIYLVINKNIVNSLLFLIASIVVVFYWNLSYLYINTIVKGYEITKILLSICLFILSIIPVVNIIFASFLFIKLKNTWEKG